MKEREISIIDLMVEILLHWRMFIIWMVIGAVLLGAVSYTRSSKAVKQQTAQPEDGQALEETLSEEELENVNYIIKYEAAFLDKKTYKEGLALMQLDPNHISRAEATIAIDGGESRKSDDIEKVYEDIIVSSELIGKVAEETGMKSEDINEMLFLNRTSGDSDGVSLEKTEGVATFRISAIHNDDAQSKKMLNTVIAFLNEKKQDVASTLGEHEIIVVNESCGTVADVQIAEKQISALNDIASMRNTLSGLKEELSDTEKQYYDYLVSEEEVESEEETAVVQASAPGISVKYVLLGAVMAAFLYAFILLLIYIFNTKIRATDNLQELYDIPQLGVIPAEKNRKKFLGAIDEWILSIQNRNKRQFTPDEALELASVAAKMAAGKEELGGICLVGCGLKEQPLEACEKIKASLEKENIQVNILNNVLYDAQIMEELEKAKGAVLIGGAGTTLYTEIVEELELLRRQGIKVLGGILVG